MSKLIVEVAKIDNVLPHGNADALELCIVKGWQCVVQKGTRRKDEKVIYIPVDAVLPPELAERLGVTKYLSNGRVRCARLRGEPSFGILMDLDDPTWEVGRDVGQHYGITKYVPPLRPSAGDADEPHPLLEKYTEVENLRNFPDVFEAGEPVVLTEKIHGANCRIAKIQGQWMAGSMDVRRRKPSDEELASSLFWHPYSIEGVRNLIDSIAAEGHEQVILFGEVYGKVQNLNYGKPGGLGFAAFDLLVDGRYLDHLDLVDLCDRHGVPRVPEIARGPFSLDLVRSHSGGESTLSNARHIREGVVVKPLRERIHPKVGRVILKYISDEYLLTKERGKITDCTDV